VAVDAAVYGQPLYKSSVAIPGKGTHNVVFVATENDSVYAYDADSLALLWHDSFINPAAGVTAIPAADVVAGDIGTEVGITGTPVIDPKTNTLYVVDSIKIVTGQTSSYAQQLIALDLATGALKHGGPVTIKAAVTGKGTGSINGSIAFDPLVELQRSGLLLVNGVVYIAWASHGDYGNYHGWIMGYSAQTLKQVAAFNDTPNGYQGGIWMSGGAPAADAQGNVYASSGNGAYTANLGGAEYGDTLIKLSTRKGLSVTDFFTPSNQKTLNDTDMDFGSGGVLLLPDQPGRHPRELVTGGKDGVLYLINRDNMGRFNAKANQVVEAIPNPDDGLFATPAYFNNTIYYVGVLTSPAPQSPVLKAFHLVNGRLLPTPTLGQIGYGFPGSTPSISANGTKNGIVWTLDNVGWFDSGPAILRAYDARNITRELYDSTQAAGQRDEAGAAVKFTVPTVANGKVYVGGDRVLTVYGLLHHS
jgi:hypothetical protein